MSYNPAKIIAFMRAYNQEAKLEVTVLTGGVFGGKCRLVGLVRACAQGADCCRFWFAQAMPQAATARAGWL